MDEQPDVQTRILSLPAIREAAEEVLAHRPCLNPAYDDVMSLHYEGNTKPAPFLVVCGNCCLCRLREAIDGVSVDG